MKTGTMVAGWLLPVFLDRLKQRTTHPLSWTSGNHPDFTAWQQLADRAGVTAQLRWVGNVPKTAIGVYYNLCDFLAMPSVSMPADGLNVCVLDAMSCGKPVVGTTVAGNPLAIVDGMTGFLVPEREPAALAAAIARLMDDPDLRRRMGAAARMRIEDELGWPHLARRSGRC